MILRARIILATAAVAIVAAVTFTSAALGSPAAGRWLLLSAVLATVFAVQAAASDPEEFTAALLLGMAPLIALAAEGSPSWLIAPFAALLLLAAELNVLSWDCLAREPMNTVKRRRLRHAVLVAGFGGLAAVIVGMM